jgi:hypothetical protein
MHWADTHPPGYFRAERDWLSPPDDRDDDDPEDEDT